MSRGSKREESNRGPRVIREELTHVRHQYDGQNRESADEKSDFAASIDAEPTVHEEAREPAASDRSDAGDTIDDDQRILRMVEVESVVLVQEFGKIKEIKPPDGIG